MEIFESVLNKYNWPTRPDNDGTDLQDIEKRIGFELPHDYKVFLLKYTENETLIGESYFELWEKETLISLNEDYKILENLFMTVGIGSNGSGELIGLEKLADGKFRVILTPFIDLNKRYNVEIGKSFSDFILRMDRNQPWFKEIPREKNF
jgi:hypothetical protein